MLSCYVPSDLLQGFVLVMLGANPPAVIVDWILLASGRMVMNIEFKI